MIKKDFKQIIADGGVFLIAEIGKNFIQQDTPQSFEVSLANAKALVDAAFFAGVDAVKFQTHDVSDEQMNIHIVSPHFKGSDRYAWVKRNTEEAPIEFFKEIKQYTEEKGILFFSTPMSRKAAEKLESLNVPLWKVGSGDVLDYVLLEFLTATKKPIIISTGMVSLSELDSVVSYITKKECPLTILYCISEYPCPKEYFNLATIAHLKEKYPYVTVGFSDHSVGDNLIPLLAVKAGAQVIEKHFSLSRDFWGSDHKVSMLPEEMKALVTAIRNKEFEQLDISSFWGYKTKEFEGATNKFRPYFNKALVFGRDAKAGEIVTQDMVYAMRPMMYIAGLSSKEFLSVLGKKLIKDVKQFEPLSKDSIE